MSHPNSARVNEAREKVLNPVSAFAEAAGLSDNVVPYTCRHTRATWFSAQVGDHDLLLHRGGRAKPDAARDCR